MRAQRAYHAGDSAGSLLGQARSVAALERAGERRAACRNRINLGYAYMEMGEYADAVAELERARADAERMSLWSSHPWALHNLGSALAAIGQLERAFAVEQAAVAHGQLHGDARLEGASRVYLSRIHLLAGNPEAAEAEGRLAVERLGPFPGTRAGAHAYLARALLRLGRTAEAVREGAAAAALLRSLGAIQEFEPVVRLVEAETLDAAGRGDEARAALAAARDRLRARAAAISEPRWRASFLAVDDAARTLALAEAWGM